ERFSHQGRFVVFLLPSGKRAASSHSRNGMKEQSLLALSVRTTRIKCPWVGRACPAHPTGTKSARKPVRTFRLGRTFRRETPLCLSVAEGQNLVALASDRE